MHRTLKTLAAVPVAALLLIGAGGTATQHLRLTGSSPAKDSTVSRAPTEIRLSFSLKPELALVRIGLASASGSKVAMGKPVRTSDSLTVAAPIEGALAPGGYSVSWQAASGDGHPIRGTFDFTLAAGAASQASAPATSTTSRDHSSHH
jgi:methionine-rich copper-binding protein CopC